MATTEEMQLKFWDALRKDRTVMLGGDGFHPRPMTAIAEHDEAPIWFFTSIDTELGKATQRGKSIEGVLILISKGHDLFATAEGRLSQHNDRDVIERLWNPFIAAWYEGKDDPKLRLVQFDPGNAQIWKNANSLVAGIKMLIGIDPKKEFREQAKIVDLSS